MKTNSVLTTLFILKLSMELIPYFRFVVSTFCMVCELASIEAVVTIIYSGAVEELRKGGPLVALQHFFIVQINQSSYEGIQLRKIQKFIWCKLCKFGADSHYA